MTNKLMVKASVRILTIILLVACGSVPQESDLAFAPLTAEELNALESSPEFRLAQQRHEEAAARQIPNLDELLEVIGVEHSYELEPGVTYYVSPDMKSVMEVRDDELTTQSAFARAQNRLIFDSATLPSGFSKLEGDVRTSGVCFGFFPPRPLTKYTDTTASISGPGYAFDSSGLWPGNTTADPIIYYPSPGFYSSFGTHYIECRPDGGTGLRNSTATGRVYEQ